MLKLTLTLPLLAAALSGHQEPCRCTGPENAVAANHAGRLVVHATVTSLATGLDSLTPASGLDRSVGITVHQWWPGQPTTRPLEIRRRMTIYTATHRSALLPTAPPRVLYLLGGLLAVYAFFAGVLASRLRRVRGGRKWGRVLAGLLMLAILSAGAVIIEGATRDLAQTEAQRAADAGALAGAASFIYAPDDVAAAIEQASKFAGLNPVRGRAPVVLPEDVLVIPDSGSIRVRVHARVYGIPRALAWIVGVEEVSVSAEATAHAGVSRPGEPPMVKVLRLTK